MKRKAAFLDRDDTLIYAINNKPALKIDDVKLMEGALQGAKMLQEEKYLLVGVSNQSGIARGDWTEREFTNTTERMKNLFLEGGVRFRAVLHCPHDRDAGCECRKPKPGMLLRAAQKYGIDLERSIMVGDAFTDIGAGQAAGVKYTFLRGKGWGEKGVYIPDYHVKTLEDVFWHVEGSK